MMRAVIGGLVLGGVALMAAACLDPDVGSLQVPFCTNEDTDPDVDVSFEGDVLPLLHRSVGGCMGCHDPSIGDAVGVDISGLDLSSYISLLAGGANSATTSVVPGRPCDSVFYLQLTTAPPSGARMPKNGPPFFTPNELLLVHDWIAEGGLEN
jgi:hypothetical protein